MIENGDDSEIEYTPPPKEEDNEDLERKKLYLLVARCIAYPFNAKYQIETTPPRVKFSRERFILLCRTLRASVEDFGGEQAWEHEAKLTTQEQDVMSNQRFNLCVRWMIDVVLVRPEVVEICYNGGFSVKELESIFKVKATIVLSEGKQETSTSEVTLWCNTFRKIMEKCSGGCFDRSIAQRQKSIAGSVGMVNQDKLYKVFQAILKIRSIEHQVLYRECQVRG